MKQYLTITFMLGAALLALTGGSRAETIASSDEFIRNLVTALAANDQGALVAMSVDKTEFKKYVWPTIASRTNGNETAENYFTLYQQTSRVGMSEASAALAGHKWELLKVGMDSVQKRGNGYQLVTAPDITLRDETGQQKTFKLVGGFLERNGVFKVTTYYVSPALRK